ncbi:hypothetical protein [Falsiroseomonas tokyonensis]|uniref:Uncharacterized protein n=1 Tax=Falsiroseomonas tokyonensis TaxID=430521 RepID=A0ABV7C2D8_9PROT|nr:hypothetical protein [Falsiroseomonas tokyonensis]MBU8541410.1 hypothetical protein [Falsiroseomonas tokyonensis]
MPGSMVPQMGEGHRNGDGQDADQRSHWQRWGWRSVRFHLVLWIAVAALLLLWLWPDRAR